MKVTELVQFVHSHEHLANVEAGVLLLQYTGVVEECAKVTTGDVFHGEVNKLRILEGVEKSY